MLELIKIANEINPSNNIIVNAGLLSRLKNKILSLFNLDRRKEVESMVEQTSELKPKLVDTYNSIKNVEDAINDLDVPRYESEINNLQPKIDDLTSTVKKIKALSNEPRYRAEFTDYKEKYYNNNVLYSNLHEFGKQFGVSIKYGVNIKPSSTGVKSIFTSWAAQVFAGKLRQEPTGTTSPGEFEEEHIDPIKFSNLQDSIPESEMEKAFYSNLPFYKIKKIEPRETRIIEGKNTGIKKGGEVEVFITSPWIKVPSPGDKWRLKVNYVIVDKGNPEKQNNFIIYRQWVIGAKKV
jgi:hypothetical protein